MKASEGSDFLLEAFSVLKYRITFINNGLDMSFLIIKEGSSEVLALAFVLIATESVDDFATFDFGDDRYSVDINLKLMDVFGEIFEKICCDVVISVLLVGGIWFSKESCWEEEGFIVVNGRM